MSDKIAQCIKCIHYYITYDPKNPYGCRAMRFKSKITPAQVVYANSAIVCQLYSPKKKSDSGSGGE